MTWYKPLTDKFNELASRTAILYEIYSINALQDVEELSQDTTAVIVILQNYIQSLRLIKTDCDLYIDECEDVLATAVCDDGFIRSTARGMLVYNTNEQKRDTVDSYAGRTRVQKVTSLHTLAPTCKSGQLLRSILSCEPRCRRLRQPARKYIAAAGCYMKLQEVQSLDDMPQLFWYFAGDKTSKAGVYCRISSSVTACVSFPTVLDATANERTMSIRCRYGTREQCRMHEQHRNEVKHKSRFGGHSSNRNAHRGFSTVSRKRAKFRCKFAHVGESYTRMGDAARCGVLSFGNRSTLQRDLSHVTLRDIKTMLLASLHDTALALVWFDTQNTVMTDQTLDNLHVVS